LEAGGAVQAAPEPNAAQLIKLAEVVPAHMMRQAMLFGNESGIRDDVNDCKMQFQSGN